MDGINTTNNEAMFEDVRKLCNATGLSIDMIAKKYGQNQNNVLALYMEVMKKIQDGLKNKEERS